MLLLRNNSDTLLVVIHEIYGINNHINDVCNNLFEKGFDVLCPNLLNQSTPFDYSNEDNAYKNFMNNIGFENSKMKMENLIKEFKPRYKNLIIIGYSVGATISWLCGDEIDYCDGIIGYYGSRIRDYVDLTPQCPTLLFFPEEEKSFDVKYLINLLNNKEKITAYELLGEHGFCDPYSKKYCKDSYIKANKLMLDFINKLC